MEIRNSIVLHDSMSPVLGRIMTSLRSTLNIMKSSSGESELFKAAERDIKLAQEALNEFDRDISKVKNKLTTPVKPTNIFKNAIMPLTEALSGITLVERGLHAFKDFTNIGDSFTLINSRIELMNDGLRKTEEIENLVYQSAQRSRAEYMATAQAVTRMGILAGDAFKDSSGKLNIEELIKFNELVNKSFVIGGSTSIEQKSALYQLTQAMASGRLQGDEMRAIREAAPLLRNTIRDYMGVSEEQFKKLQKEGQITADVVKQAVLSSANEINNQFEKMPITASQAMTIAGNTILTNLEPLTTGFSSMVANIIMTLMRNMDILIPAFMYFGSVVMVIVGRNLFLAFSRSLPYVLAHLTAFMIINGKIMLVIGTVMLLIGFLLKFPQIFGYIMGSVYAFGNAFMNVIKAIGNYFILLINEIIITGINKILAALHKTKIEQLSGFQYSDLNFSGGYKAGTDFISKANNKIDNIMGSLKENFNFNSSQLLQKQSINVPKMNIGEVDRIKGGKISLDEDSIKYLNEQGKLEFVNRYTTMSPNINLQFGDIHETADVDQLIDGVVEAIQSAYETSLEAY